MHLRFVIPILFLSIVKCALFNSIGANDIEQMTRCSKFDFEEKLLEKLVRLENKMDVMKEQMTVWEGEIKKVISKSEKVSEQTKETVFTELKRVNNEIESFILKEEQLSKKYSNTSNKFTQQLHTWEEEINSTLKRLTVNSKRVGITACYRSNKQLSLANPILKFDDIRSSTGIRNTTSLTTTGKFNIETDGLYLIATHFMSHTSGSQIGFYVNGKRIARTYLGLGSGTDTVGGVVVVELHRDSKVWIQSLHTNMFVYGSHRSCLTIVKIN